MSKKYSWQTFTTQYLIKGEPISNINIANDDPNFLKCVEFLRMGPTM